MPEALEDFLMTRPPTAERPLLGQTVLAVEDSRFACEALRLICQRSGARIRRADSLRSAARHLRTYRPTIVVIDVGLPDGSGLELIKTLAQSDPRIPAIIAMSGDDANAEGAIQAGADTFISKPITSVAAFQSIILAELPKEARPSGLRPVTSDVVVPDRIALRDDFALAAELLTSLPDPISLAYVTDFLNGIAKSTDDTQLHDVLSEIAKHVPDRGSLTEQLNRLKAIVQDRLRAEQPV